MDRKRLPTLPDTGRRYLDETLRARLASPGVERFPARRGRGGPIALAVTLALALLALMLALS